MFVYVGHSLLLPMRYRLMFGTTLCVDHSWRMLFCPFEVSATCECLSTSVLIYFWTLNIAASSFASVSASVKNVDIGNFL